MSYNDFRCLLEWDRVPSRNNRCVYRNVTQNRAFKCCECFTFHMNDTVQLANPHPVYTYLIRIHTLALATTVLWVKRVTYYYLLAWMITNSLGACACAMELEVFNFRF